MEKTVKTTLKDIISQYSEGVDFDVLVPPNLKIGDYSTNVAFGLAQKKGQPVPEIAEQIADKLKKDKELSKIVSIEIISPGFINFKLTEDFLFNDLARILKEKEKFGDLKTGKGTKVDLEFVSANPTGPLTVGNARAASYGDTLGNVLNKAGYKVTKEYYVNDMGVQVQRLGESVAHRLYEFWGLTSDALGEELYKGDYVIKIAEEMDKEKLVSPKMKFEELAKVCQDYTVKKLLESAKASMANLNVEFDEWFSEKTLHDNKEVEKAIKEIEKYTYDKDDAKWFRVSDFYPEEQDAVILKSGGTTSYLMNDIAYTRNKLERRKYDKAINVWGADHHGDVKRLLAGAKAIGQDGKLEVLLHQLVSIKEKDERQRMSKREGKFVLLDDFISNVGKDAIRFFFLVKDLNTHVEFDVELAKKESRTNPVFYIQYAFARLSSIFQKAEMDAKDIKYDKDSAKLLTQPEEVNLLRYISKFPDTIEALANNYQVHHLAQYALGLATDFHRFYEAFRVMGSGEYQPGRLQLTRAVAIVLKESLRLMGISSPEKM